MKKKSMLIASLAVMMLLLSSVSMAATPNAVTDSISSSTDTALAAGDRLRDGSCGNTPSRDGSGNPNAPRRGGGGGRR